MDRAVHLALGAEQQGNLPIAALITLGDVVVAEAANGVFVPAFSPGRHAELWALELVPEELWPRASDMTCYTTLEPCLMCFGAIVTHGVGRVVFGSCDPLSGATGLVDQLPEYVAAKARAIMWIGPAAAGVCDDLRDRALERARTYRQSQAAASDRVGGS